MARAVLAALLLAGLVGGCGHGGAASTPTPAAKSSSSPVVAQHQVAPRQLDLTVRSAALGRSAKVRLLTPVGWTQSSAKRWPVLYLLHGCCDTYESWTRSTDIAGLPQLRDVLVVMPEGGDIGFYSDWAGGPRTRWETFHTRELPALLRARYGASRAMAVAGLSMGGLGAMDYAARHRGLFRAAASFSGVLHPLAEPRYWTGLFSQYERAEAVWGDPRADRANWAAHDPTALAGRLRGVRLYVAAGDGRAGDAIERVVGGETRRFTARLKRLGIPARTHLYRGGRHDWPYWQRELHRALPVLLAPLTS